MARRKLSKDDGPKTGYGNGSIHEEKKDSGRWIAELDGVRRRAGSEEEAREKLRQLQERRTEDLALPQGSMTVGEWMDMWLAEAREDLKP